MFIRVQDPATGGSLVLNPALAKKIEQSTNNKIKLTYPDNTTAEYPDQGNMAFNKLVAEANQP